MEIVSVIHVLVCCFLIVIILFQSGKGGGVSGAFGGGIQGVASGNTTATVLGKITAYFAAAFMITSLTLSIAPSGPDVSKYDSKPEFTISTPDDEAKSDDQSKGKATKTPKLPLNIPAVKAVAKPPVKLAPAAPIVAPVTKPAPTASPASTPAPAVAPAPAPAVAPAPAPAVAPAPAPTVAPAPAPAAAPVAAPAPATPAAQPTK